MFPSPDAEAAAAKEEETTTDGVISYVPYSDGVDDGSMPRDAADRAVWRRSSLSAAVARLAGCGQPVTCVMCTLVSLPLLDVARELNIPVAIYWIQMATLLAINYHFVPGYRLQRAHRLPRRRPCARGAPARAEPSSSDKQLPVLPDRHVRQREGQGLHRGVPRVLPVLGPVAA
jgi:hypothetical protein